MPSCGNNCRLFPNIEYTFLPPPALVRQTHRNCNNCHRSVSDYSHNLCYMCAMPSSEEYRYHHARCLLSNAK